MQTTEGQAYDFYFPNFLSNKPNSAHIFTKEHIPQTRVTIYTSTDYPVSTHLLLTTKYARRKLA